MSNSRRRYLPEIVSFRVAPDQAALLREAARPASPGQFARRVTLRLAGIEGPKPGRRPLPRVADSDLLRSALRELGHIGGNLNQLAHLCNAGRLAAAAEVAAIQRDLAPVRARILIALGIHEDDG